MDWSTFDPATDTVANVTTVATCTTNTDIRGTDGANTVAPDNTSIAAILADTNELQTNQGDWATADVSSLATQASVDGLNDISVADILASGNIDGYNIEEALKLCLAVLAGKISGAGTTTILIRAADDSKDRITATVDSNGNRSSVSIDTTG